MLFSGLKPWGDGVHRWLRGELPARVQVLELDAAMPSHEYDKPRHNLLGFIRASHARRGHRMSVLKMVCEHLTALNRYPVSVLTRWLHALVAEHHLRPALGAVYTAYTQRDASRRADAAQGQEESPESDERKEHTQLAIEAAQQLATCYALVLKALCRLPDRAYALCHEMALKSGHRILELICAEQHFCALRRMKLPERSWRNCNQLYFALSQCEDVQREMALAGYLSDPDRRAWQPKAREPAPTHASVQQIYIALQVTGMMDPGTWPPQQFFWMLVYLRRTLPRLKLHVYKQHALNDASVIITCVDHRPPTFKMRDNPKEPALVLDVGPLLRRVERDLERLNAGQQDTLFKRLVGVSGVGLLEQAQLLEHMLRKLHYHPVRDERSYVNQYIELNLHSGFSEVFAIVKKVSNNEDHWCFDDLPLIQQVKRNSPVIELNGGADQEKAFFLMNESSSGMQFKFQEARNSKPLFIGQIIACMRDVDNARRNMPQIAYVSRMQRNRKGEIEVAVQKLAYEAECVGVQDPHMQAGNKALPGLLVHCLDGKWRVLLHSKHGSYALSKLFLCSGGQTRSLRIGRMYLYQPEFVVFDMIGFEPG